jgi:Tfp pilus assembly protein PilO
MPNPMLKQLKTIVCEISISKRRTLFLLIIIAIAITIYQVGVAKFIKNLRAIKHEQTLLIQGIANSKNNQQKLKINPSQMANLEQQYQKYMNQLLQHFNAVSLANIIVQTASNSNLQLDLIKPNEPTEIEFYKVFPVTISANGNYHQFQQFLNILSKHNYFFMLDRLVIEKSSSSDTLNINMNINFYSIK